MVRGRITTVGAPERREKGVREEEERESSSVQKQTFGT